MGESGLSKWSCCTKVHWFLFVLGTLTLDKISFNSIACLPLLNLRWLGLVLKTSFLLSCCRVILFNLLISKNSAFLASQYWSVRICFVHSFKFILGIVFTRMHSIAVFCSIFCSEFSQETWWNCWNICVLWIGEAVNSSEKTLTHFIMASKLHFYKQNMNIKILYDKHIKART